MKSILISLAIGLASTVLAGSMFFGLLAGAEALFNVPHSEAIIVSAVITLGTLMIAGIVYPAVDSSGF